MAAIPRDRQTFSLAEQLDQVALAQTRAHEAWEAARNVLAAAERLQVAADLRMGTLLLEMDALIERDGGPDAA